MDFEVHNDGLDIHGLVNNVVERRIIGEVLTIENHDISQLMEHFTAKASA